MSFVCTFIILHAIQIIRMKNNIKTTMNKKRAGKWERKKNLLKSCMQLVINIYYE